MQSVLRLPCAHVCVCLVVTRPGAASMQRLCNDFRACEHSDPHVVYACMHDVWKSFMMCASCVHVCMYEERGMKTNVCMSGVHECKVCVFMCACMKNPEIRTNLSVHCKRALDTCQQITDVCSALDARQQMTDMHSALHA
jgi:hypothetical protein